MSRRISTRPRFHFFLPRAVSFLFFAVACCDGTQSSSAGPASVLQEVTEDNRGQFLAGAYARNINPLRLPVWVNGGIAGRQVDRINDPLHARSLVLSDGTSTLAICIVDSCGLPLEIVDKAKELIRAKTGIDASHVMIAATHTHSAVSVWGAHGTPVQEDYAAELPVWIADSVAQARDRMVPAQWGTASVVCDRYIYCRDWLMKPGTANSSPFSGRASDSVSMNPGYDNPNKLAPVGPVDMLVPILSIQDMQGKPISLLATFCTHYAGAPNISADYFAVVCERLGKALRPESPEGFVGLMSNSTSGNANCIDFSKPAVPFTHIDVGTYVSDQILSVLPSIQYSNRITLDEEATSIDLAVRMPSEKEVATAKRYIETHFADRLPLTQDENYARETVLLSELPPTRKLNLQAFRLNDFLITANPCESYNETGLKLRQASPFRLTMNIGLANGHAGYNPPPEMFELGGYTTWRCRSSCLEEQAEPKMVDSLVRVIKTLHARRAVAKPIAKVPQSPIAPLDSLKWIETSQGYASELAACEPQVIDPVSMQIDEHGRMWVVEMRDYPTQDNMPRSRIVVLQDKDQDGFFETSTVFADKLLFATGVQPWQNGALVTVQGKLIMLRDTDGDFKSDSTEVWLEGFAAENPQLRANHPILGSDGWLYIASGLRGGKIHATVPFAEKQSETIDLAGCDLRMNMLTGKVESIAGPSQFGLSLDDLGHRYGCSNRQPCFEIVSELRDINLSPLAGLASPMQEVSRGETASHVHPLVNAWTTSNLHAGQFTAACGVLVTHSRHFEGAPFATVLTCEPTGSLVQRRSVERRRGYSQAIEPQSNNEWVASHDPWFRPVDLYEGPGGDIFIVDMYRAVIEHPDWVPAELKNRPDQRMGDSHGRIYRVTKKGSPKSNPSDSNPEILGWLQHKSSWNRNIATRRFLEGMHRGENARLISELQRLGADPFRSSGSITNTIALLVACNALDENTLHELLHSAYSEIRTLGWQSFRNTNQDLTSKWANIALNSLPLFNTSLEEAREIAWVFAKDTDSKKNNDSTEFRNAFSSKIARTLREHGDDPHLWMAASAACKLDLARLVDDYYQALVESKDTRASSTQISREAVKRLSAKFSLPLTDSELHEQMRLYLARLQSTSDQLCSQIALAVMEGCSSSRKLPTDLPGFEAIIHKTALSDADSVNQLVAVRLLSAFVTESSQQLALRLLESPDAAVAQQAIATCAIHNRPEFGSWLLDQFPSALPQVRQSIFAAIRSNPQRLSMMVDRLESGAMTVKSFDAAQIQNLKGVNDAELGPRIAKILGAAIQSDRQKVIDEYTKQLVEIHVDEKQNRGKAVFEKNCIACHRLNGIGTVVGPDISDSREQTFEKLLISVLDPSRAIDANYVRYMARIDDGTVIEGVLKDSNAKTVTLQNQNGTKVIERNVIEELKSSAVSLMPEGIEAQISPHEMAELLWYIKNWRYALDNVPANATLRK